MDIMAELKTTSDPLDGFKRHSAWIAILLFALILGFLIFSEITKADLKIDNIVMSINAGQTGPDGYGKIQQIEADKNMLTPTMAYVYAAIGVILLIPLTTLLLYSLTKVPFLKLIIRGDNNSIDDNWERRWMYLVLIGALLASAFVMGCAITLMKSL